MQFLECFLEPVNSSRARFEHHYDLGLVGQLVFPPVKRARAGEDRTARYQTAFEQLFDELRRFFGVGESCENDDRVGVARVYVR